MLADAICVGGSTSIETGRTVSTVVHPERKRTADAAATANKLFIRLGDPKIRHSWGDYKREVPDSCRLDDPAGMVFHWAA